MKKGLEIDPRRLRDARERKGYSQKQLALELYECEGKPALESIERQIREYEGKGGGVMPDRLRLMAEILSVSIEELMPECDPERINRVMKYLDEKLTEPRLSDSDKRSLESYLRLQEGFLDTNYRLIDVESYVRCHLQRIDRQQLLGISDLIEQFAKLLGVPQEEIRSMNPSDGYWWGASITGGDRQDRGRLFERYWDALGYFTNEFSENHYLSAGRLFTAARVTQDKGRYRIVVESSGYVIIDHIYWPCMPDWDGNIRRLDRSCLAECFELMLKNFLFSHCDEVEWNGRREPPSREASVARVLFMECEHHGGEWGSPRLVEKRDFGLRNNFFSLLGQFLWRQCPESWTFDPPARGAVLSYNSPGCQWIAPEYGRGADFEIYFSARSSNFRRGEEQGAVPVMAIVMGYEDETGKFSSIPWPKKRSERFREEPRLFDEVDQQRVPFPGIFNDSAIDDFAPDSFVKLLADGNS